MNNDNLRTNMGKRMKSRRHELNLTQEQMAEKLNFSVKHYGEVERGLAGVSLEALIEISNILNLDLEYLVKGNMLNHPLIPSKIIDIYLNSSPEQQNRILRILEIINEM